MRHSLYKYYSNRKWAEAFLDGQILFRSLSYFLDYEDKNARRDQNEGTSVYRPEGGLVINNLTQGTTFTLPRHAFLSKAKQEEIFVFCASRSPSDEHREKFDAAVCVEILVIKTLCDRIEAALPPGATFRGQRVKYYQEAEGGNPRWALPDKIVPQSWSATLGRMSIGYCSALPTLWNLKTLNCDWCRIMRETIRNELNIANTYCMYEVFATSAASMSFSRCGWTNRQSASLFNLAVSRCSAAPIMCVCA
jgi:hypothetical protein